MPSPAAEQVSPYVSSEPLTEPRIFGPQILSAPTPEFATTFSPDGSEVYFNTTPADRSRIDLVSSRFETGGWKTPQPVPFAKGFRNLDPFITADGKRLYFSSDLPTQGKEPRPDTDIWFVERTELDSGERGWSSPVHTGPAINNDGWDIYTSLTLDGTLYFSSDREGTTWIYRSRWTEAGFEDPQRLSSAVNFPEGSGNPCIASDESFLLFSADLPGGLGGSDLYLSLVQDGEFTPATRLPTPINSAFGDFAPALSPDGKYLFFTSERPGIVPAGATEGRPPGDLYQVELAAVLP
ncbi:MAG: hypothetical protein K0U98_17805 [Deltaproteobacteria bacterium]|nr:hypothetical protein [Deltaproteobacteria bacterium]